MTKHLTTDFIARQERRLRVMLRDLTSRSYTPEARDRDQLVEHGDAAQADEIEHLQLSLAELDSVTITDVEHALRKLKSGKYGTCELTGNAITAERLAAMPHTRYSIEGQRELERQRANRGHSRRGYGIIEQEALA